MLSSPVVGGGLLQSLQSSTSPCSPVPVLAVQYQSLQSSTSLCSPLLLVSTHQSCRLNVTQAQLLQHQGALAVTRTILHRCQKGTESTGLNSAQCCLNAEPCCRQVLQNSGEKHGKSSEFCNLSNNEDFEKETSGHVEPQEGCKDGEKRSCAGKVDGCSDMCVYKSNNEAASDVAMQSAGSLELSPTDGGVMHRDVNGLMRQAEKLLQVPFISVTQLDDPGLNSAIQNLGCVKLPPTSGHGELLPLPHCELLPHSELLPHCLEEYGDADHHVLHKSVRPDSSEPIDVRQPYLVAARARRSFKKTSAPQQQQQPTLAVQEPSLHRPNMATDKKEDLVKWLRRMQLDTPTRIPDLPAAPLPMECAEVCVEEACQGNEVCASFSDCFLNGQCHKNATEKVDQSSKWRLQQQQQLQQETQASQLLLHQKYLLHKLKKQVLEETNPNVQTPAKVAGWIVPTNVARKRFLSDQTSAIQPVIAHMNAIQRSSNGSWLLMAGTNSLDGSIASLNLRNKRENSPTVTTLVQDQWVSKKMRKDSEKDEAKTVGSATFRSAILYQAPTARWRLDNEAQKDQKCHDEITKPMKKLPESEDVDDDGGESRTINNDWLLKKCDLKSSPKKSALEKTMTDNENSNVFLANRIKSQLSLASMTNIENLKERIDKMSAQAEKQVNETTSGTNQLRQDDKDAWLLQQSPAQQADNKILEEIMKKKSEWLSTSSQASFSVISESESRGSSWLLS
ncbi:hypothetical protein FHG87_020723 [Trinorchestia longiramus]|nr:hypothetical protein FHG87_020723 [Trinorchestia longiramus]